MNEKNIENNRRPFDNGFISIGQGKGIKWVLWENNVTFQRQEKFGDQWQTVEEFHAPLSLLKEIAWRISHWLAIIDQKMNEKK
ncbi:MAG: hypothetical protein QXX38_00585 [Candidatus Aenigmatarchaeota archaeon]